LHVVCYWIGNKLAVAAEHYLQVTEAHYEQAVQKAVQLAAESGCQEVTGEPGEEQNVSESKGLHAIPIAIKTYDYPQGDSNPCLSRERATMY
jgi:hypothetical protein